jgi:L-amino acid N-acyltransferase YncA
MAIEPQIANRYPRTIQLDETLGSPGPSFFRAKPTSKTQLHPVPLRLMTRDDKHSIHLLARNLPQEDLLFLRSDITDPVSLDAWIESIEKGNATTILAEPDGTLEGYASIHLSSARWTQKIGELAINVAPEWQSRGLGEGLCAELLALAEVLGLRKVFAQMMAAHKSARALFERLGFHAAAFLPDWVEDREGQFRDLLVMVYDLKRSAPSTAQP